MADVITRFRLETTQYDSKLRDAAKSLSDLTKEASRAGDDFNKMSKDSIEAARALGSVASGATNTKDKLRDLVNAYNNVARAYNNLTDAQKQSDFGKAMAESLQSLQGQITQTKQELNGTGGVLDTLKGKFTVNIDAVKMFQMGMQALTAAADVAKDAFFKNEEQLDEWGRIVNSADSLYSGFLSSLNTGNISGYLQNMNNIVNAARAAYDALDSLGTFNAFNQINQAQAQTNLTNAIADYREGTGSKDAVRSAAETLKEELQQRQAYEQQAYEAFVANIAAQRGVSASDLMMAMSGSYGNYLTLKNTPLTGSKETVVGMGAYAKKGTVAVPANDAERLGLALRQLNDTELKDLQALGAAAQRTANEIANTSKMVSRVLRGNTTGGTGGNIGGGSAKDTPLQNSMDGLNDTIKQLNDAIKGTDDPLLRTILEVQLQKATRQLELTTPPALSTSVANSFAAPGLDTSKLMEQAGVDMMRYWTSPYYNNMPEDEKKGANFMNQYNQAVGGLSQIAGGFKQMGIDLPEEVDKVLGVLQGISSIIAGVTAVLEVFGITGMTANTTALIANTAALAANTAAVGTNSILGFIPLFGGGGIAHAAAGLRVPGNFMANDMVPAMVNSGELILNQAEQGILAANLQQNSLPNNMYLVATISGEMIRLALNNNAKRTGHGEYVTTKRG